VEVRAKPGLRTICRICRYHSLVRWLDLIEVRLETEGSLGYREKRGEGEEGAFRPMIQTGGRQGLVGLSCCA
jgi:hypothetical protein